MEKHQDISKGKPATNLQSFVTADRIESVKTLLDTYTFYLRFFLIFGNYHLLSCSEAICFSYTG